MALSSRLVARMAVAIAGMSIAALTIGSTAGSAAASTAQPERSGPSLTSGEAAGYVVTGAHFANVSSWVRLPDPASFSREIGSLTISAQLWTASSVLDLKLTACTDSSCRPGGKPAEQKYHLEFDAYSRTTGALICSTAGTGSQRCPNVPRSFTRARFAAGRTVSLGLNYPIPHQWVFANGYTYPVQKGTVFTQARLGVEFGPTPFASASFRAPKSAVPVVTFDRPKPPPYFAEIVVEKGSAGGIAGWWTHHELRMTSGGSPGGHVEAAPSRLSDDGYRFTIYLEP